MMANKKGLQSKVAEKFMAVRTLDLSPQYNPL